MFARPTRDKPSSREARELFQLFFLQRLADQLRLQMLYGFLECCAFGNGNDTRPSFRPGAAVGDLRREVFEGDELPVLDHGHHSAHLVFQLAHIAWKVISPQSLHRLRGEAGYPSAYHAAGVLFHEVFGQYLDVFRAVPQGWNRQLEPAQAVVEVAPEAAFRDELGQRPIGRRDDSDAATSRLVRTQWLDPRPSWRKRRRLTWTAGEMSEISSRKTVPPSAARNNPSRSLTAPVNAPRLCPNNSDCSRLSDSAPQF